MPLFTVEREYNTFVEKVWPGGEVRRVPHKVLERRVYDVSTLQEALQQFYRHLVGDPRKWRNVRCYAGDGNRGKSYCTRIARFSTPVCPTCGQEMVVRDGRFGTYYVCPCGEAKFGYGSAKWRQAVVPMEFCGGEESMEPTRHTGRSRLICRKCHPDYARIPAATS